MINLDTQHPPRDYRGYLLVGIVIVLVVYGGLFWWGIQTAIQRPRVELSDVVLLGPTSLCPGETLDYRFVMKVSNAAQVEVKTSVQRLMVDEHVSFARLQEFQFEEAGELVFIRHSAIPPTYADPVTGREIPWAPGRYEHRTVVNVAGDRQVSTVDIPFSIREGCPN